LYVGCFDLCFCTCHLYDHCISSLFAGSSTPLLLQIPIKIHIAIVPSHLPRQASPLPYSSSRFLFKFLLLWSPATSPPLDSNLNCYCYSPQPPPRDRLFHSPTSIDSHSTSYCYSPQPPPRDRLLHPPTSIDSHSNSHCYNPQPPPRDRPGQVSACRSKCLIGSPLKSSTWGYLPEGVPHCISIYQ
jgi:hypothetical protein